MYTFTVPDMNCGHCVKSITGAVRAVDAEAAVDADLEAKRVRVDSRADVAVIAGAIEEAGFTVTR